VQIATQQSGSGKRSLPHRRSQLLIERFITQANRRVDRDKRQRAHVERSVIPPREQHQQPFTERSHGRKRRRQRYDQTAIRLERVEPGLTRVRDAGIDQHRIESLVERPSRIAHLNLDPGHRCEMIAGLRGQRRIHFDGDHASAGPDDVRHDGCVVTEAAADVENAGARLEAKRIDALADEGRRAVEE